MLCTFDKNQNIHREGMLSEFFGFIRNFSLFVSKVQIVMKLLNQAISGRFTGCLLSLHPQGTLWIVLFGALPAFGRTGQTKSRIKLCFLQHNLS